MSEAKGTPEAPLHFGMLLMGSTESLSMTEVRQFLDRAIGGSLPELLVAGVQISTSQFRDLNKIPTMGGILIKERAEEASNVNADQDDDSARGVPGDGRGHDEG